jgi:TP901 family phage tail tape measure protein
MSGELGSKLGFDVSDAISSLRALKTEFEGYSASLLKSAGSTDKFNAEQEAIDKILVSAAASAEKAAGGLKEYLAATGQAGKGTSTLTRQIDDLIGRFNRLSVVQSQNAASAGRGGVAGAGPLTSFVNDRASRIQQEANRLQQEADQRSIATFNQKVRFENTLLDAERQKIKLQDQGATQQLRTAFGRPTIPLGDEASKQGKTATGVFNEVGLSYKGLLKIFATQIAFSAIGQFVSAAKEGVSAAIDFETQLGQIQTISEEFRTQGLNATADAVRELSDQFGAPIQDVAAGLYESLSNQVGNATESVNFLTEALRFGKGAVTSTADSVDLLSGIMNAYGFSAASAASISDQLFVTIDRGRVKGEDLANTFGRVAPLAATLGIQLGELNTGLAELTIQGVKPSDALTQLTNVMLKLIKPTEDLQKVFDKLGVSSAEAGIAAFGFDGFIRKVTADADGSATEIGKLFNQIRGTRGVIGIVSRDTQKYADTLAEISNASRNASRAIEASNTVLATPGQQLTIELNKAKNFLINDFGRSAIQVFNVITQNIISAKNALVLFSGAVISLGTVLGAAGLLTLVGQVNNGLKVLGIGMQLSAANTLLLRNALATTLPLLATAAIALAGVVAVKIFTDTTPFIERANDALRKFNNTLAENVRAQVKASEASIQDRKEGVSKQISETIQFFQKIQQANNRQRQAAFDLQNQITGNFKDQLDKRESLLTQFLNKLESAQKNAAANIQRLGEQNSENRLSQQNNRFERDLKGLDPDQQANLIIARVQRIMAAARQAFAQGTPQGTEFGNKLLQDAFTLANRVADQDQTRARGEALINNLLKEQDRITQQLIGQEQAKASAAGKAEDSVKATILETKRQIDEFNQLQEQLAKGIKPETGAPLTDEDIAKIKVKLAGLGAAITANLQKVGQTNIPKILGLQDLQRQLLEPFVDPFTKQLTSLDAAAKNAMTQVLATLNKVADEQPVEIKILFKALTGKDITGTNLGEAQNQLAQVRNKLLTNIENEKNLPNLQGQVSSAANALNEFIQAAIKTGDFAGGFLSQSLGKSIAEFVTFQKVGAQSKQATENFGAALRDLQNRGVQAALSGDTATLEQVITKFRELQAGAKAAQDNIGKGHVAGDGIFASLGDANTAKTLGDAFGNAAQQLELLAKAQANLKQAQGQQTQNNALEQAFQQGDAAALLLLRTIAQVQQANQEAAAAYGRTFTPVIATATTEANTLTTDLQSGLVGAANSFGSAFAVQIQEAEAQLAQLKASAAATAQGKARGGIIHFFNKGGFAPRGTDTVPAMLTPGEFVVNAASTRKFYSDLVAINAGVRPVYRAQGGPVTNITNVGDVKINVPESAGRVDGRVLAKEFRRELRRGTIKR